MNHDFSPIAEYMEKVLVAQKGVPGCDVIISREHEQLFRYTCGNADQNALYYLYSCTKPITAAAGMRLAEEGRLDLDRPVADYLPAFAGVYLEENGVRRPPSRPMTVRHLFTMSAGLNYNLRTPPMQMVLQEKGDAATLRQVMDAVPALPLDFDPGERFQYSLCHDVLAAVIEEAAGMRFSEYLQKILFDPLEMADSTFHPTPAQHARLAEQYVSDSTGKVSPTAKYNSFFLSPAFESGGAGLVSSTADYSKFADAMACGGRAYNGYRLLKPETVRMMHTEQLSALVCHPETFGCASGPGYGYGLGVRTRIDQNHGERTPLGEFGWDGAAGAYIMMDAGHGLSIAFTMHVLNWPACIGAGHGPIRELTYTILEDTL